VNTGFGRFVSQSIPEELTEELQLRLLRSHACGVGEPYPDEVIRAAMLLRANALAKGRSGARPEVVELLLECLDRGLVPVVPSRGSVGASGDLAPLAHLALPLVGEGEAWFDGERLGGGEALERAGLAPVTLSHKEGLALNNGTAQMLATGVLAIDKLEDLADTADLAAAMTIEAFAGRTRAFDAHVHALRPHPGQVRVAANLRALLAGSTLADIPYHLVPRFRTWQPGCWADDANSPSFDLCWEWVPPSQRHGRERYFERVLPFRGGKKHQPQDSYSLRCVPQVHGAVRDAIEQAKRVFDVELNSVTDNPLVFPDLLGAGELEDQVVSAGHFHGMPLALALSYLKAAIPVLASISERRLNKLVDPATNDGLPGFLIGNEDGTESGFMIVQYTAAAIVNDLATRAHPASVYSIPTSANAEDHVSMGANEGRHVLAMADDLGKVLALELYTAAQALDFRRDMLGAAQQLARTAHPGVLKPKVGGAGNGADAATLDAELEALRVQLVQAAEFAPGPVVAAAHARLRKDIPFMPRDRAMDRDIARAVDLVERGELLAAARGAMGP
jgi:histidine ammonia-lyase